MKKLFIATLVFFGIAGAIFWFMGSSSEISSSMRDKLFLSSAYSENKVLAQSGDPAAQYKMAKFLEMGEGVSKDIGLAIKWYKKSADQGYGLARYEMGLMYAGGIGVRQNYFTAAKWFRLAATFNNHVDAQFQMGELHFNGRGIEHDYGKAIKYYTKAASKGHAAAQFILASMFEDGWGVKQDYIKAYMWLSLAIPNKEAAMAVNPRYNPVKKLELIKEKMNKFQMIEADKRLLVLRKGR